MRQLFLPLCSFAFCLSMAAQPLTLPPHRDGWMDIHCIATGMGEANLIIMPDGTSLLVDAGDVGQAWEGSTQPDPDKSAGENISAYISHFTGRDTLDYFLLTHFHADHFGNTETMAESGKGYGLSGITMVGENTWTDTFVDRDYPSYNFPTEEAYAKKPFFPHYRKFLEAKVAEGAKVERFAVGSRRQFRMKRNPRPWKKDFEVYNMAGGGMVHSRGLRRTRPMFHGNPTGYDENSLSCVFRLRYGKFSLYSGGDLSGSNYGLKKKRADRDFESQVAPLCGKVSVMLADHHGWKDAVNPNMLWTLAPEVVIIPAAEPGHPDRQTLARLTDPQYPGRRMLFTTSGRAASRIEEELWKQVKPWGHVVVRVYEGGTAFQIFVLDALSPNYRIIYNTDRIEL